MKKLLSCLAVLTIMFVCIFSVSAEEPQYKEVDTKDSFVESLESDGDMNIIVTKDIVYTCKVSDIGDYWITLGDGKKILNLNGQTVELNAETGMETTMIKVPDGASLIINDTSGNNSGKLFCYGRMESPRDDDGVPRYFNSEVKHRNVLDIDGGTVTINGGTLEAGRSKKMWIYDGRDIYNYKYQTDYALQGGILAWTIGVRYDGYAYQQVNGDCITVNDGSLLINDGVFLGRGFAELETYVNETPAMNVNFSRSACLRLSGGATAINGGTFWGRGNANVFDYSEDAKITVKSGTFSTNHLRVIEVPTISVTGTGWYEPNVIGTEEGYMGYNPASEPGSVRLTSDMLDPQRNTAELNGETLPVSEWAKLNATGNDGAATVVVTHHMSNADRRSFMSGRDTKKEISRLNIDGTNAYGMTLSPDVLSCSAEGVRSISVEWYHNDELCDDETAKVAGKYQAKVSVVLESKYAFSDSPSFSIMGDRVSDYELSAAKRTATLWSEVYNLECNHSYNEDEYLHFDNDRHFMQCSVCDKVLIEEAHEFGDGEHIDGAIVYKCRTCDFSYGEADDGKIRIDYVNINISTPKTGYSPEYFGIISGEGISFSNGGDEFTKSGIRWGLYANDFGVGENDLFASDMRYRAVLYLRADEGYTFSKDQNAQYNPVVIVNGEEAEYETDGELMTVKYEVNTSEITVSYINITGIDFPEAGEKPDCEIDSFEPQYYDAKADSGAVTWYEDGEYMNKTDTFKAGKEYRIEMYIDTIRSGWDYTAKFAENLAGATVDGFSVAASDIERLNDTTVKISYTFRKLTEESPFTDVSTSDYFYDAVIWAKETGITVGSTETAFSPYDTCTRAQGITSLHRAAGKPSPKNKTNPFTDIKKTDYFYEAVLWGVEEGIVVGTSKTTFTPNQTCSVAHIMTMLFRAMKIGTNGWYEEAREWAKSEGLLDGTSFVISPEEPCPRAGIVYFLYKFYKK